MAQRLGALDRIADLNAVAWRDDDAVLAEASAADRAIADGTAVGPLHGVPITVKDWIDVGGFPCAGGEQVHRDRRPSSDAVAAARLRAAGAIVIAKSTVGEVSELHGPPRNPWDPARTPGHTSSGEAVLVATGASTAGLGSDSGGSLRFPAHCCGITALKPTYGRVPSTGHFPRLGQFADARTVIGPLGRTVDDLRVMIGLISGPDGHDPACPPVSPIDLTDRAGVGALRVAVQLSGSGAPVEPGALTAVEAAASALDAAGAHVEEAEPLDTVRALDITQRYWDRRRLSGSEADRLLEDWDQFREAGLLLLQRFDLIVSPAAPHAAPTIGASSDADWTFTLGPSLWGWPAIVVRANTSVEGLPLGVQVVAGPWREDRCLAAGEVIESALGPWLPPRVSTA